MLFKFLCVISNISLIRPSTVLSCSLTNAQRDEVSCKTFGEVQMINVIISDLPFAFSGIFLDLLLFD